jgi:hypothetical protein
VHAAQAATADATHAVLGETTTRSLLYVALSRGRDTNIAYPYERKAAETEHEQPQPDGLHVMRRGTSREAAQIVCSIIATRDQRARTAHDVAEAADRDQLPDRVRRLVDRRTNAVHARRAAYGNWCEETADLLAERERWIEQHLSRSRDQSLDYGIDL